MRRKTLSDIARIAKVTHVTVSLALRAHPRIPAATRARIEAIAKRIGYRPDPVLSALMAYRRGAKPHGNQETLAWINVWPKPEMLRERYGPYWRGTLERCEELGYKLEEFRLAEFGMRTGRLSQVLSARNIHGLFIPPQFHNRAHLNLEWEKFSAITFGYTLSRPQLHVVTNAHFRAAVSAMRNLRRLGHRRIGLALEHSLDERTDHNYIGGYLTEQLRVSEADRIPIFVIQDVSAVGQKKFAEWYRTHRPDAILSANWEVEAWMRKMGYRANRDYSLAMFYVWDPRHGGIDQNEHLTGRTAVDLLVGMLHRSERGVPEVPLRTLVEGRWVDGKTVRRMVPATK